MHTTRAFGQRLPLSRVSPAVLGVVSATVLALAVASAQAADVRQDRSILFSSNRAENLRADVFAVGVDRNSRRNLTRTLLEHDYHPRPSPDGRRILFQRGSPAASIFVMARDGANALPLGGGGSPVWSPNGTKIAFTRSESRGGRLETEVFVMNADGSGARLIAAGHSPTWSSDGSRLGFVRDDGRHWEFVVVDAAGAGEHRLAVRLASNGFGAPRWSPDGRLLVTGSSGGSGSVTVIDIASGQARELVPGAHPQWSRDGSLIAFARPAGRPPGIGLVRPDGAGLRFLTSSTRPRRWDDHPMWSPDGRRLAFVRTDPAFGQQVFVVGRDGRGLRRVTHESAHSRLFADEPAVWLDNRTILFSSRLVENDFDLFTMHSDGTRVQRLTDTDTDEREAAWSPDGRRVAFVRTGPVNGGLPCRYSCRSNTRPRTSIWVMDADGRRLRRLTPRSVEPAVSPAWSPDGRRLAFIGVFRRGAALYVMDADGKRLSRVRGTPAADTHDVSVEWPAGKRRMSVDWSPDGKRLVYAWQVLKAYRPLPLQVFVIPARGGRPVQLTGEPGVFSSIWSLAPRWSPDGRTIAFVRETGLLFPGTRQFELMAMTASGRDQRPLVKDAREAAWSPDGRRLVFSLSGRLAVARRDGSNIAFLTRPGPHVDGEPDWVGAALNRTR